ncbi:hypothetical protein [Embleya sp. NPDC005575]|uniref:hypothetical protein n=1 Tax=Embleya sp. NPDC005575 TaxID=3156892 RepID=UPI0033BE21B5
MREVDAEGGQPQQNTGVVDDFLNKPSSGERSRRATGSGADQFAARWTELPPAAVVSAGPWKWLSEG